MSDEIDSLLVDVRASTDGFTRDIARMRSSVDSNLVSGFTQAGQALEKGLTGAIQRGSLGFDDLKRVALGTLSDIAAQSVQGLFSSPGGSSSPGSSTASLSGLFAGLLGLPGRATGGNVSPGRGYIVGERGPEMFVPTSAGRIETGNPGGVSGGGRDVKVSIHLSSPRGSSVPQSLQRSSRQVASTVRRALSTR
ncbi:tail tape measure protein [Sphingomonas sp. IC081]|uniref:tail tape measure protein n=1 Tax=Sphingomonas sp. IC081 TaxID=304378 RepID=UPI00115C0EE4|nr:tail tape measure protein [Sphingomonas sp. IC081]QDK34492.1 tail tape measure protein [Sphingomonas sp. IC081]